MTDRNKIKDKRIWKRMAYELSILSALINYIYFDEDYRNIIGKKTWNRLFTAYRGVIRVKSDCDDIYYNTFDFGAEDLFYGVKYDGEDAARELREKIADLLNSGTEKTR